MESWIGSALAERGELGRVNQVGEIAGIRSEITAARLAKLKVETRILAMDEVECAGELVKFCDLLDVARRAVSAMTSTVMGLTHIKIEDWESIIHQLRAAGEIIQSNGSVMKDHKRPPTAAHRQSTSNQKHGD